MATNRTCTFVAFLFGIPIGCLATLGIMGIMTRVAENLNIMKFGDITIAVYTSPDANDRYAEELQMLKDGRVFCWARRNGSGEVPELALTDGREHIRLRLGTSPAVPGRWVNASYGGDRSSATLNEEYIDFDFDGQFDVRKLLRGTNGELVSRYIYVGGTWRQVSRSKGRTVFSGPDAFRFQVGLGWQLVETRTGTDQIKP